MKLPECCIDGCNVQFEIGRSFHRFPSDERTRQVWFVVARKNYHHLEVNPDMTICSKHFAPYCFEIKNGISYLKNGAIPSRLFNNSPLIVSSINSTDSSHNFEPLQNPPEVSRELATCHSPLIIPSFNSTDSSHNIKMSDNPPEVSQALITCHSPLIVLSVNSTDNSHNVKLPHNPPEVSQKLVTWYQTKAEGIDGQKGECIVEQTDSSLTTIKQEDLSESDNPSVSCNLASPSAVLLEKTNDSLDIEDEIPHALINKECDESPPRNDNENPLTKKMMMPSNTQGVKVFNVLQSINLTNTFQKSKLNDNLLNYCTPRIVMTQSLAPNSGVASNSNVTSEPLQSKSHISSNVSILSPKFIREPPNSINMSTNPTTLVAQFYLLQKIQPMMTDTNQIQFVSNSGGQSPKQVYFAESPQNDAMMMPQISDVMSLSTAGYQKLPEKKVSKCKEKTDPSTTQASAQIANSAPHILRSKLKTINSKKKKRVRKNVFQKRPIEEVFDLTDDKPSDNISCIIQQPSCQSKLEICPMCNSV